MTPADLSLTVLHAVRRAVGEGALPAVDVPSRVILERPRAGGCGDWATNAALRLAGAASLPARHVAEVLRARIDGAPGVERVDITGPGFLNFTLRAESNALLVRRILDEGLRYGHGEALRDVDVVFAAPRELRASVVTEVLVTLLRSQGARADVAPIAARPAIAAEGVSDGLSTDTGGTASAGIRAGAPDGTPDAPDNDATAAAAVDCLAAPVAGTPDITSAAGTPATTPPPAPARTAPAPARATPAPARATPAPARATPAPAPHRPVERVSPRAVGYDVQALGRDACRWALLRPAGHDRVLGPGALLRQSEANPLFTVRYAHSRARALVRNAEQLGFVAAYGGVDGLEGAGFSGLLGLLGDHPAVVEAAARHRAPDRVARHLEAVADAFLGVQHTVLPLGDEKPSAAHRSRLAIAEAAGTVLAGGLSLLGISAPDHL
ncbi:ArgS-related anticodon-binding protein NrtL [Streptomyces sp. NPDC047928]|uniref:ArgS-related anticodon-binding protein NrtL n=1 Tax=unclassified Streptomyces TaxID=2593676 RepID=UPI00371AE044